MRIFLNALSASSLAGHHVIGGLVQSIAVGVEADVEWLVVASDPGLLQSLEGISSVEVFEGPPTGMHWAARRLWQFQHLAKVVNPWTPDVVVSYSGILASRLKAPQVCMACNPRPFVSVPFRDTNHWFKYPIQRYLYRRSSRSAALNVFNSDHIQSLYHENGMPAGAPSVIVPHGISEEAFSKAERNRIERRKLEVVSASTWSRYKGSETLVDAISAVREQYHIPATLRLLGRWDCDDHRLRVQRQLVDRGIEKEARIEGYVSRGDLLDAYARAQVFALPSYTESFGIPALEAQAFGTPTVGSSTTAMPETCGEGGVYCEPGDSNALAKHLALLLSDDAAWQARSEQARMNARKYRWSQVLEPFVEALTDCCNKALSR